MLEAYVFVPSERMDELLTLATMDGNVELGRERINITIYFAAHTNYILRRTDKTCYIVACKTHVPKEKK